MGATDISGYVSDDGKTGGRSATEPVGCECLVTEDRAESVGGELSGCPVSKELENEANFREGSENTSNVEFEILILLLVLVESIKFEFLEDFVVDDRVFSIWTVITVSADVVKKGVEEVVLEVDAVTNMNITTSGRNISFETSVHSNTTCYWTVNLSRGSWNVFCGVTNGKSSEEWISACKLYATLAKEPTVVNISYSGEGNNKSSKIVLDIETFHHTTMELLDSC